eukprot:TRINITY_DN1839_c0_g1_i1.p1 TRINITY_DN1839_c0_g1~~TRINITY_DN1839_c0_g1_i1.p1  ORF type:complete len:103 (-),score=4.82 TRINITY_DN1839_c0_g1_i1:568-876(-)
MVVTSSHDPFESITDKHAAFHMGQNHPVVLISEFSLLFSFHSFFPYFDKHILLLKLQLFRNNIYISFKTEAGYLTMFLLQSTNPRTYCCVKDKVKPIHYIFL